jgi:hypothetical protein
MAYNSEGPVHIFNEGAYVRVTNDNNGVVVNYVKANLVIQKDSATTFFLKNDSYINYYNYTDISTPVSTNLNNLMSQITSWNNAMSSNLNVTSTTTFDNSMMDSLSRLKVSSHPNSTLNLITTYDKNPLGIDEIVLSNASSSHNSQKGSVNMSLVSSSGSRIIRQSKLYTPHVFGSTSTAIVNGILTTNNTNSNVVSKIGLYDNSNDVSGSSAQSTGNGIFFAYDNSNDLSLVYRTNYSGTQVDTIVKQADWNIDTLDGAGPSAATLIVTAPTNFVFEWNQTNPSSYARAGVYTNGITYCHVFSNVSAFGNPSLPVRWEMSHDSNLGSANAATMVQGPACVFADEIYFGPNKVFQYSMGSNFTMLTSPSTVPLYSLRLEDSYERAKLYPKDLELVNIAGGGVGQWELVLNATLSNAGFSNIATSSYAQGDRSATSSVGGLSIASGYIYDAGVSKVSLNDKDISLLCGIDGTQDVLTLLLTNLNGTLNVTSSIEWVEKD